MRNNFAYQFPNKVQIIKFRRTVLRWFAKNARSFPWRRTRDPFRILVAEIMLRRTRAEQVNGIYKEFLSHYPDVHSLASAHPKKLDRILSKLGLRWRIPAFRATARYIIANFDCRVPDTRQQLLSLPGVGDYVAGAVLSSAFGKREWIVDSNVVRVFKRYFGIPTSKEGRRDKHIIEMAKVYVSCRDPRIANLAILDFAALVCMPRNPRSNECPLRAGCHHARMKSL